MNGILLLNFLIIASVQTWEFCKFEEELCTDKKNPHHLMCGVDDIYEDNSMMNGTTIHSHMPSTKDYKNFVLNVINAWRDQVAGGTVRDLPKAAKMRELIWDYELEFLAKKHNVLQPSKRLVMDKCRSTKRFPNVGQYVGGYGFAQFRNPTFYYLNETLQLMWTEREKDGVNATWVDILYKNARGKLFANLVTDRTSRVGCATFLLLNCRSASPTINKYCMFITCNFDNTWRKLKPVYKSHPITSGAECSEWGGASISKTYPHLCANDGSLYPDKVKE